MAANRFAASPSSRVIDLRLLLCELALATGNKVTAKPTGNKVTVQQARYAVVMAATLAASNPTRATIRDALTACDEFDAALTHAADSRPARLLSQTVPPCEPEPFQLKNVPVNALDWQTKPPMGLPPDAVAQGHENRAELIQLLVRSELLRHKSMSKDEFRRLPKTIQTALTFPSQTVKSTIAALSNR